MECCHSYGCEAVSITNLYTDRKKKVCILKTKYDIGERQIMTIREETN
jgi:hypothetical protein